MLSTLLSKKVSPEDKIQDLEENYDIPATEAIRKEVSSMCNYSSYIFEEGLKQGEIRGEERGEKRGEKRGQAKGMILGAIGIMRDDGVAEEKIMQRIMKKYPISEDDAKRLMDEAKEFV